MQQRSPLCLPLLLRDLMPGTHNCCHQHGQLALDEAIYHPSVLGVGEHDSRCCSLHKGIQDAEKGALASLLDPNSDKQSAPLSGMYLLT